MRKLSFKSWMILFILIAGVSWSVLPTFTPSFNFNPESSTTSEVSLNSQSTTQPVGQASLEEEVGEQISERNSFTADQSENTTQNNSEKGVDQQKILKTKQAQKSLSRKFQDSSRNTTPDKKNNNASSLSSSPSTPSSQGSLMVGGASTPKEIKVSETGEGETLLLREALRQLLPGGSILLQKGYYKLHLGDMRIPNSTIRGEGKESILEFNDTFKVNTSNITLQNLKIIHYGTSEAFAITGGKKLTLDKVLLQSNANDGIAITHSHFVANDLELHGSQHAFLIKDAASFEAKNIKLSDVDYGIYFESDQDLTINGLSIKNSNVSPIHFVNEGKGQLTCVKCSFDKKPSNNAQRLIIKK